jgi:hypothetical protein
MNGATRSHPATAGPSVTPTSRRRVLRRVSAPGADEGQYESLQVHIVLDNSSADSWLPPHLPVRVISKVNLAFILAEGAVGTSLYWPKAGYCSAKD